MVIVGIGDGLDAGAALFVNDRVVAFEMQERLDRTPRSRGFPWGAIDAVLSEGGLRESDVDLVTVGGRFTPPFFLRRHPGLRKVARDVFSPAMDATVFFQAMLRQSGLGAMEADRAQEWIAGRLNARGFHPQRVVLMDVHRALASAAYRCQPEDEAVVLTLHPMGDGVAVAVHHGCGGQLDRVWEQRGFASLHLHLQRCAAAIGLKPVIDDARMWGLAGRGTPDPRLLELLEGELYRTGARLSSRSYPLPESRAGTVYQALTVSDAATSAASVLENLRRVVVGLVRHHVRAVGCGTVALGGAVFENPRLVAAVAEMDEVDRVWATPDAGWHALALGSVVEMGGLHNQLLPVALGRDYSARQCRRSLEAGGLVVTEPSDLAGVVAEILERGGSVARFSEGGGLGRHGGGTRSVLVRGDDPDALERARWRLERSEVEEPVACVLDEEELGLVGPITALRGPLRYASAAPRVDATFARNYPAVVTPDGRAHVQLLDPKLDPGLVHIARELQRRCGCGVLAVMTFAMRTEPAVAVPADAVRAHKEACLDALILGPYLSPRP